MVKCFHHHLRKHQPSSLRLEPLEPLEPSQLACKDFLACNSPTYLAHVVDTEVQAKDLLDKSSCSIVWIYFEKNHSIWGCCCTGAAFPGVAALKPEVGPQSGKVSRCGGLSTSITVLHPSCFRHLAGSRSSRGSEMFRSFFHLRPTGESPPHMQSHAKHEAMRIPTPTALTFALPPVPAARLVQPVDQGVGADAPSPHQKRLREGP